VLETRVAKSPHGYVFQVRRPNARKQKIEAAAKLQAYVEAAHKAKELQEKQQAESFKPPVDEWGNPIYQTEDESPQNPPREAEIEVLPL